jgi:hypothetical protein
LNPLNSSDADFFQCRGTELSSILRFHAEGYSTILSRCLNNYVRLSNGMSWSKSGSVALASVTALKRNKECDRWFEKHQLNFKLAA